MLMKIVEFVILVMCALRRKVGYNYCIIKYSNRPENGSYGNSKWGFANVEPELLAGYQGPET